MSAVVRPFPAVWRYFADGATARRNGYWLEVHADPRVGPERYHWQVSASLLVFVASGTCGSMADAQAAAVEYAEAAR